MTDIHNGQDIMDSRDVIERLEELEGEREALVEALEEAQEAVDDWDADEEEQNNQEGDALRGLATEARNALEIWDRDELEELETLKAFAKDLENYGDWEHGETLIRATYFTEYAQELLVDIGVIPKELPDYVEIDWESTANNLLVDYTESELDGVTYYMRA